MLRPTGRMCGGEQPQSNEGGTHKIATPHVGIDLHGNTNSMMANSAGMYNLAAQRFSLASPQLQERLWEEPSVMRHIQCQNTS